MDSSNIPITGSSLSLETSALSSPNSTNDTLKSTDNCFLSSQTNSAPTTNNSHSDSRGVQAQIDKSQGSDCDSDIDINGFSETKDTISFPEMAKSPTGTFSCHLCSFVCKFKDEFRQHLLTHYTYNCDRCDYASRTEGRLKRHIKDFHSEESPDNFSGQKVPTNNPKSLKCKHCGLISSTKERHWHHQRTHLDLTKCLQCPHCPFITEYKHHLEYHLRNHDKLKPYKCAKCQYRCVNKSMLNSHKKSHSNVYQFRCADCAYASKYCHSLKQHLTRHGHNPAPVLNEDGSLPSYDNSGEILSMKRGPNNRNISSTAQPAAAVSSTIATTASPSSVATTHSHHKQQHNYQQQQQQLICPLKFEPSDLMRHMMMIPTSASFIPPHPAAPPLPHTSPYLPPSVSSGMMQFLAAMRLGLHPAQFLPLPPFLNKPLLQPPPNTAPLDLTTDSRNRTSPNGNFSSSGSVNQSFSSNDLFGIQANRSFANPTELLAHHRLHYSDPKMTSK